MNGHGQKRRYGSRSDEDSSEEKDNATHKRLKRGSSYNGFSNSEETEVKDETPGDDNVGSDNVGQPGDESATASGGMLMSVDALLSAAASLRS